MVCGWANLLVYGIRNGFLPSCSRKTQLHQVLLHVQDSVANNGSVLFPTEALRPDRLHAAKLQRQPTAADTQINGGDYDNCDWLHSPLNSPLECVSSLCPQSLQWQWQVHCCTNVKDILAKAYNNKSQIVFDNLAFAQPGQILTRAV